MPPEWRNLITEPTPRLDLANLPAPTEGILVTLFITVRKVARSRDFYSRVLGGTVVLDENPCIVKLSNSWIIMNPGGPPTPDKPGISVVDYQPDNTTSIFMNLRVADIHACYQEWPATRSGRRRGQSSLRRQSTAKRRSAATCGTRTDTSSRSASRPACCTASAPQSARRISRAELCQPCAALCCPVSPITSAGTPVPAVARRPAVVFPLTRSRGAAAPARVRGFACLRVIVTLFNTERRFTIPV
jgi:hypothetical protein